MILSHVQSPCRLSLQLSTSQMDLVAESAFKPGSPDATRTSTPVPSTLDGEEPHASSSRAAAVHDSDVGSSSSSQGPAGAATLEREVEQVVHNLSSWGGSLWGGLRKQVSIYLVDKPKSPTEKRPGIVCIRI